MLLRERDRRQERIESTGMQVPGLQAEDQRRRGGPIGMLSSARPGQSRAPRINAALVVRGPHDAAPHAEIAQREVDRVMAFLAHEGADHAGAPLSPSASTSQPAFCQDAPARGGTGR